MPGHGCVIALDSTKVNAPLPRLLEHVREAIVGSVTAATVAGHALTVSGRLFSDLAGSPAETVARLAMRGAPYQMSVGLFGCNEQIVLAGQSVNVNGRTFPGPIVVLRNGRMRDCSVVTLRAEYGATVAVFSGSAGARPPAATVLAPRLYFAKTAREAAEFRARQARRVTR